MSIAINANYINKDDPSFERVKGVEPSSRPWQGRVIAVIPHPLMLKSAAE